MSQQMGHGKITSRRGARRALAVGAALLAILALASAPAHAAPSHAFDATLSLTGGCGTTKADPVADPGLCPMPPGVAGVDHPSLVFRYAIGATVDSHGNVYVANISQGPEELVGLISVFSPAGKFLTQIEDPHWAGPLAVDSQGNLYVSQVRLALGRVVRYTPSAYPPTAATTYGSPTIVDSGQTQDAGGIAVNRANDHLLAAARAASDGYVKEYSSAAEGNTLLREIGNGVINPIGGTAQDVAVNAATGDIFVAGVRPGAKTDLTTPEEPFVSGVYVFGADGKLKTTIEGSDTPAEGFRSNSGKLRSAIDEASGEVFVTDLLGSKRAYRFVPDGKGSYEYVADPELESHSYSESEPGAVAVVNHPGLPNSRNVYITSTGNIGHLYAFTRPSEGGPPLTVDIEGGSGTVVSNPAGIECTGSEGKSCSTEAIEEGTVTLTASPAPGYLLMSWKHCDAGGVNGRQCTIALDEAKQVGVRFVRAWSLEGSKAGGLGILSTSPGGLSCSYACGSSTALYREGSVTLKAKPARHFHFVEFTGGTGSAGGCNGVTTETCTIAIASDSSIKAVYAEDAKNTLSLAKTGGGQGFVKTEPAGINCGPACASVQAQFFASESPTVTVTLGKGTSSVTWVVGAGTCTGNALTCTVPTSSSHSLVAKFD